MRLGTGRKFVTRCAATLGLPKSCADATVELYDALQPCFCPLLRLASVLQAASSACARSQLRVHKSAHRLPCDPHESQYHSPRP